MKVKVEFSERFIGTNTGDTWRGYPIMFSIPGNPHALVMLPDSMGVRTPEIDADLKAGVVTLAQAYPEIEAMMRDAERLGEIVDDGNGLWRLENIDYGPLGWIEEISPLSVGDTFVEHGLTPAIRARGKDGEGILVSICDTGIDSAHQVFAGIPMSGSGKDRDSHGHGTHVASTAASIIGIAPKARIHAGWALPGQGGSGTEETIASSIREGADLGAKVINLSLGGGLSSVMDAACAYAAARGAVVLAAAGNSGNAPIGSPARGADIIAMAHDRSRNWASFSQGQGWGNPNRAGFNGVGITAALYRSGSGVVSMSGTSMACPHGAGIAAILFGAGLGRDQVLSYILGHRAAPPTGPGSVIVLADFGTVAPPPPPPPPPITVTERVLRMEAALSVGTQAALGWAHKDLKQEHKDAIKRIAAEF